MAKGLSSIEPDESGGQVNAGQETSRGLVVASGNGPELLELGEEILDQMPGLVEVFVEGARCLAALARWDHRRLAGFSQRLEHALVRIERFVGNERLGFKLWEQGIGSGQIMLLTAGEMKAGRIAERIDGGVNFGAQPSARAPDGLILTAFLRAPALCWWARTMVESIIAYSLSASSESGCCLAAERCWDQVRWAIEAYAWRFDRCARSSLAEQEEQLRSDAARRQHLAGTAASLEAFRERVQGGLAQASFEQRRQLVLLLIDRVVVTDAEVEIRYVLPTSPDSEHVRFCHLRKDYFDHPAPGVDHKPDGNAGGSWPGRTQRRGRFTITSCQPS